MLMYTNCLATAFTERSILVYWTDEDLTSIVDEVKLVEPGLEDARVGVDCSVKAGREIYRGKIIGIGKIFRLSSIHLQ